MITVFLLLISHISRVTANYVLKFPNIRYRGNKGRSGVYFNDTIKLVDPDNPLFGANILHLSLTIPEL